MRKLWCILLILCVFQYCDKRKEIPVSSAQSLEYAKVLDECYLYKNKSFSDVGVDEVYFQIPETYFVLILEKIDENCFKVQYGKYVGYVNSSKVEIASFVPIVKTLEGITCDIKTNAGTQIWSSPTTSSSILTTIRAGTKGINYIAACKGVVPSGGESNVWYYVSYTPFENSTSVYEGYIYSENVAYVSEIFSNLESNPEIIENQTTENESLILISSTLKTVILAIVALPITLLIVVIMYKLIKKLQKNTNNNNFAKNYIKAENEENVSDDKKVDIEKFKMFPMRKIKNKSSQNLPEFPKYDTDDDLL